MITSWHVNGKSATISQYDAEVQATEHQLKIFKDNLNIKIENLKAIINDYYATYLSISRDVYSEASPAASKKLFSSLLLAELIKDKED